MLLLFVRVDDRALPVEVPIDGRVRDLYDEVRKLGYDRCVLSHGGDDLSVLDMELSETGLSAQSAVDLRACTKIDPQKLRGSHLQGTPGTTAHSTTALDKSGQYLVYFHGELQVRDLETGAEVVVQRPAGGGGVTSVAVSASGSVYFVQASRNVLKTDLQGSEADHVCVEDEPCRVLCSADGDDWLVRRNQKVRPLHSHKPDWLELRIADDAAKSVRGCAALIKQRVALAVNQQGRVDVYCCKTGDPLFKVSNLYYPQDVACDGFGGVVIADGANHRLLFADGSGDEEECRIGPHGNWPWSVTMRGATLIAGLQQAGFVSFSEDDKARPQGEVAYTQ